MHKIESVNELVSLLNTEYEQEFFILFKSGVRSSKNIMLVNQNEISMINEIDDTESIITIEELNKPSSEIEDGYFSNLKLAIETGALYAYDFGCNNLGTKDMS